MRHKNDVPPGAKDTTDSGTRESGTMYAVFQLKDLPCFCRTFAKDMSWVEAISEPSVSGFVSTGKADCTCDRTESSFDFLM
jgi:hypothetical protein